MNDLFKELCKFKIENNKGDVTARGVILDWFIEAWEELTTVEQLMYLKVFIDLPIETVQFIND